MEISLEFNPRCSKCRTAQGILTERGVDANIVDYLKEPPTVDGLRQVMGQLGLTDPRQMMRTGETVYRDLGLAGRSGHALLPAMVENRILLERPILVRDGRAVIARPPERVLELLNH